MELIDLLLGEPEYDDNGKFVKRNLGLKNVFVWLAIAWFANNYMVTGNKQKGGAARVDHILSTASPPDEDRQDRIVMEQDDLEAHARSEPKKKTSQPKWSWRSKVWAGFIVLCVVVLCVVVVLSQIKGWAMSQRQEPPPAAPPK